MARHGPSYVSDTPRRLAHFRSCCPDQTVLSRSRALDRRSLKKA
jgi:hypothetical protein